MLSLLPNLKRILAFCLIFAMGQAALTGLASRGAVSMINNKFDIGKVAEDLTSKESLYGLGLTTLTAGLTFGIADKLGIDKLAPGLDVAQRTKIIAQNALINTGVRGALSFSTGEKLTEIVKTEALSGTLALGQSKIGDIAQDKGLKSGSFGKIAMHSATGSLYSLTAGSTALSGAIGGASSELVAGIMESGKGTAGPPLTKEEQQTLNNNIKATTKLTSATVTMLAGGNAKDITLSANVGESALKYNRRLHPEELKYIKALQEGKTPQEKARYAAAALSLVKGDKGVNKKDPNYQTVKNVTELGGGYSKEQQELMALAKADGNENAFTYSLSDSVSDFVSRNNEIVSRATGGAKFGLGSVGVMASAGLGTVAVPITGGTSAVIASVTGTGSAYFAFDGYNQAFGSYTSSEGTKVLQSANVPTDSFALEKGKELAIDTGIAITGAAVIKGLGYAGSKVLESSSAQKVKSVLFKGEKGTNVATKTTTTNLSTGPDSGHLYDSGHSPRIGISAIDGKKDRRVHEVLGGYGENISAKDFKLQVQAEKALDAHAKKIASSKEGVRVELKQPEGKGAFQLDRKIKRLDNLAKEGNLAKIKPGKRNPNKTKAHRKDLNNRIDAQYGTRNPEFAKKAKNTVKYKMDMDHIHELQLGGPDIAENLQALLKGHNRSIGRQIQHQIKGLPEGTKVDSVTIIKQK